MERVRAQMSASAVCERAARWEAVRRLCGAILEAVAGVSRFHDRRAEQAAGRTLRDLRRWCLLAVACGISRAEARTMTRNFEPLARKMTGVRWSHLMHSMNQVHKMSDS